MHAVDAQQHRLVAVPVEVGQRGADLLDGQPHAGAGVHPGDRHDAGARGPTAPTRREVISSTVAVAGSSYSVTRRTFAPLRWASRRSASSVEKKSWVVLSTSSPADSERPPYMCAMPIVVESVSANSPGTAPV